MSEIRGRGAGRPGDQGPQDRALGFMSNVVIGVASTAPAYSLAVSLGLVAAAWAAVAGDHVARVPADVRIAMAYYYMNRADPDCGTSFTWVTRAMGPSAG